MLMTGTWSYALGQQQSSGVLYIWRHGAAMMDLSCNNAAKEKVGAPGQWAAHLIVTHNVHLQSLLLFIHGLTIGRSLIDERRTIEEATDRVGNNWQVQKKKLVRWFMISPSESKKGVRGGGVEGNKLSAKIRNATTSAPSFWEPKKRGLRPCQ